MNGPISAPAISAATIAVVVCRDGRLPAGADETVAEAHGRVLVVGRGSDEALEGLPSASECWWADTGIGAAALSAALAPVVAGVELVLLPASPDGRDLAPRLAAMMGRPLLAGAVRAAIDGGGSISAELLRVDGRVAVPVHCDGPAVATLMPGVRSAAPVNAVPAITRLELPPNLVAVRDAEVLALVEPDPATMDLADATRVMGGGAGLVPRGATDEQARSIFVLLSDVAAALGASAAATHVVTDAGWMSYDRQIGTTGVAIDPDLYIALGVSGASQHVGGLGAPAHTVSVNTDASCPMTAIADLGLVADALRLTVELAGRLGVPLPDAVLEVLRCQNT